MTHRDLPLLDDQQLKTLIDGQGAYTLAQNEAFARHHAHTLAMLESFIETVTERPMPRYAADPKERLGF